MTTDSEIVERSFSVPAAFGELFDRHASAVSRYVSRRIGEQAASDVVSETFLIAFQKRRKFDLTRPDARPWLFGIATLAFQNHRRDEARVWRSVAAGAQPDVVRDLADDLVSRLDASRRMQSLARALAKMPASDRDTLLLYAWGELDYEQIAVALDVPVGTVRSRLHRARTKLRAAELTLDTEEDRGRSVTAQ